MTIETKETKNYCDSTPGVTKEQKVDTLVRLERIHKAMHHDKAYGFEQTLLCDLVREINALRRLLRFVLDKGDKPMWLSDGWREDAQSLLSREASRE